MLILYRTHQPRKVFNEEALAELTDSIRKNGVIQPLVLAHGEEEGTYVIIAGERRWRASGLAGLRRVPAVVRELTKDTEKLELALIENIQREDLIRLNWHEPIKTLWTPTDTDRRMWRMLWVKADPPLQTP